MHLWILRCLGKISTLYRSQALRRREQAEEQGAAALSASLKAAKHCRGRGRHRRCISRGARGFATAATATAATATAAAASAAAAVEEIDVYLSHLDEWDAQRGVWSFKLDELWVYVWSFLRFEKRPWESLNFLHEYNEAPTSSDGDSVNSESVGNGDVDDAADEAADEVRETVGLTRLVTGFYAGMEEWPHIDTADQTVIRKAGDNQGGDGSTNCAEHTYGEILLGSFRALLSGPHVAVTSDDVFVDLGAGVSKNVIAAFATMGVRRAIGVELSRGRLRVACGAVTNMRMSKWWRQQREWTGGGERSASASSAGDTGEASVGAGRAAAAVSTSRTIEIVEGDIMSFDFAAAGATVVYAANVCFRDEMNAALTIRLRQQLQPGSRIMVYAPLPEDLLAGPAPPTTATATNVAEATVSAGQPHIRVDLVLVAVDSYATTWSHCEKMYVSNCECTLFVYVCVYRQPYCCARACYVHIVCWCLLREAGAVW